MVQVFISYRRNDSSSLATLIAKELEDEGISVFVDTRRVDGGGPFPDRLYRAIEEAPVFVCMLGKTTLESKWVQNEIKHATNLRKTLIPIFQESYIPPEVIDDDAKEAIEALLQSDGIHIFDIKNIYVDEAIARLVKMIKHDPTRRIRVRKPVNWTKWGAILGFLGALLTAIITLIVAVIQPPPPATPTSTPNVLSSPSTPTETVLLPSPTPTDIPPTPTSTDIPPTPTPTLSPLDAALERAWNFAGTKNGDWQLFEWEFEGVTMVLVPKGCFMMGSVNGSDDEKPVHERCFDKPFWIDKYEVTNAQYGSTGAFPGTNRPRDSVSWLDAREHCLAQGRRLPSEREWEYAARGVENWIYPWGNTFIPENVVYKDNSEDAPSQVGSLPQGASWVGAQDMVGNLWEWTNSIYQAYPNDAVFAYIMDTQQAFTLRGGAFNSSEGLLSATNRLASRRVTNSNGYGLRCARDV